jgi:hypothetical protein
MRKLKVSEIKKAFQFYKLFKIKKICNKKTRTESNKLTS